MDCAVSAFSVYNLNKKLSKSKKNKSKTEKGKNGTKKAKLRKLQSVKLKSNNKTKTTPKTPLPATTERKSRPIKSKPLLLKNELTDNGKDSVESTDSDKSFDFVPVKTHSTNEGINVFKWLIAPCTIETFFNKIWEKTPTCISGRETKKYYKDIISTPLIDAMLRKENIQFTKNIDITSYTNGIRETHNPPGRAHPNTVWDYYLNGCSVRLLNPQTYMPRLHLINATLQEFTHSFVGANAYLTPPDSQGFAPHFDDIEAFILQVEGKKHWKVYRPGFRDELSRVSSMNLSQNELGKPIVDVVLEAGDLLYFPRGYIHQASTIDGEHSLHVTISMFQKHSWADLFEKLVPIALDTAISNDVEFRRGLPFDIFGNFGLVHTDQRSERKTGQKNIILSLFDKLKNYLPLDDAVDELAKKFYHEALPPVLSDQEKAVTVFNDSDVMIDGKVINRVELEMDTKVRLLRKNILRMVKSDNNDLLRIYYYVENSLEYQGNEVQYLEVGKEFGPILETLVRKYPQYVAVDDLLGPSDNDNFQMAKHLWEKGLIMTEYPLEIIDE